jgi:RNA 2',3'-cyclic 3'-phosphodiesterase
VRAFIAIEIADPARSAVVAYLETLRATADGVAWTRPENLHLTLKFLGNVEGARLPSLTERVHGVAAAQPAFALRVAGVGAFPSLARPRVLWVGVRAPELAALAVAVDRACVAEGFPPEPRPLHPHVTLGRVRERGARPRTGDLPFLATDGGREFGHAAATSLVFFRSELGRGGARHEPIAILPFPA